MAKVCRTTILLLFNGGRKRQIREPWRHSSILRVAIRLAGELPKTMSQVDAFFTEASAL